MKINFCKIEIEFQKWIDLTSLLATFIIEAEDFSSESTSKSYNQFILKEIKDELLHEDPPIITDKQGSVHDTS